MASMVMSGGSSGKETAAGSPSCLRRVRWAIFAFTIASKSAERNAPLAVSIKGIDYQAGESGRSGAAQLPGAAGLCKPLQVVRVDSHRPEAHGGVHLLWRIRWVGHDDHRAGAVAPAREYTMVDESCSQATMAKFRMREQILDLANDVDAAP